MLTNQYVIHACKVTMWIQIYIHVGAVRFMGVQVAYLAIIAHNVEAVIT